VISAGLAWRTGGSAKRATAIVGESS